LGRVPPRRLSKWREGARWLVRKEGRNSVEVIFALALVNIGIELVFVKIGINAGLMYGVFERLTLPISRVFLKIKWFLNDIYVATPAKMVEIVLGPDLRFNY
jgi:hypothetical protein